ncbi:hypothetical protein TPHA_0D01950 [Tetrapisispora phaffii CBS 4417]|uniref:CRIB domain-containing protein n=1 Tax=Tetrapisispora phaffii (strain ATCC 24235 / CBS 4417 / NBRC 1672 / NRRL Y-8282 / UCD 70-5) TaxID=1071381 RepID=G8BSL2_TETPH|nr:hypothetical protein TPHA_0D01950 [Tetrapisispora phaffii CBS 4417]CCE62833.1 hypothetical protein TPHA_0D01950 [Tetrapisispora phaffii CBS 4417]
MFNKINKLPELHSIWLDDDKDVEKLYGLQNQQCLDIADLKTSHLNHSMHSLTESAKVKESSEKYAQDKFSSSDSTVFDHTKATKYNIKVINSDELCLPNKNNIILPKRGSKTTTLAETSVSPSTSMSRSSSFRRSISMKSINIFRSQSYDGEKKQTNSKATSNTSSIRNSEAVSKEIKAARRISVPYDFKHISHADVKAMDNDSTSGKAAGNEIPKIPETTSSKNLANAPERFSCAFVTESIPDYQFRLSRDDSFYNERPKAIKNLESIKIKRVSSAQTFKMVNESLSSEYHLSAMQMGRSHSAKSSDAGLSIYSGSSIDQSRSMRRSFSTPPKVTPYNSPRHMKLNSLSNFEYPTILEDQSTDYERSSVSTKDTAESLKTPTIASKLFQISATESIDGSKTTMSPSYTIEARKEEHYTPLYL